MAAKSSARPSDPARGAHSEPPPNPLRAPCEATLLRVFIGDDDVFENRPLYDQLVLKARSLGIAGATVTRGLLAYGPATIELEARLRLSEDLPVILEIVDHEENIQAFLAAVDVMLKSSLVTVQKVSVIRYGRKPRP
jgi:uncharacterized protein